MYKFSELYNFLSLYRDPRGGWARRAIALTLLGLSYRAPVDIDNGVQIHDKWWNSEDA